MSDGRETCSVCNGTGEIDDASDAGGSILGLCLACNGVGRRYPSPPPPDVGVVNDGFRKRRKRPKGWYEKAIKNGSVRAPGAPDPDEGKERTGVVVNVPLATAGADGKQDS